MVIETRISASSQYSLGQYTNLLKGTLEYHKAKYKRFNDGYEVIHEDENFVVIKRDNKEDDLHTIVVLTKETRGDEE